MATDPARAGYRPAGHSPAELSGDGVADWCRVRELLGPRSWRVGELSVN